MIERKRVGEIDLQYKVTGGGQPVLLLHGWGWDLNIFAALHARLEPYFKVYTLDFPGFGGSSEPPVPWGVEDYTRMLEEFVRMEGLERPILVGHSFGGRVSLVYASRNPVHKVILVDAAGVRPRRGIRYYTKVLPFKLSKKVLPVIAGKAQAARIVEAWRRKAGSADYNAVSGVMRTTFVKVVNEDLQRFMPLIGAPTLLIWGDRDTATPLRDAKIMERLIPDAGLVVFEGAGHYSFLDRPYDFGAVVDSFLARDKRTGAGEALTDQTNNQNTV